jgi:hypothetical protein
MPFTYDEFDLSGVRTYPLAGRASKARAEDFGRPFTPGGTFADWLSSLPAFLGARDIRTAAQAIVAAARAGRGVVWGIGAHVI